MDGAARVARALDVAVREAGAPEDPVREARALDDAERELTAVERFGPGTGLFARVARERVPAVFLGGFLEGLTRGHLQFKPVSGIAKRAHTRCPP